MEYSKLLFQNQIQNEKQVNNSWFESIHNVFATFARHSIHCLTESETEEMLTETGNVFTWPGDMTISEYFHYAGERLSKSEYYRYLPVGGGVFTREYGDNLHYCQYIPVLNMFQKRKRPLHLRKSQNQNLGRKIQVSQMT